MSEFKISQVEWEAVKARLAHCEHKLGIVLPEKKRKRGAEYPKMVYKDGTSVVVNDAEEEQAATGEVVSDAVADEVEIPEGWEELHPQKIISIAKKLGVESVTTKDDAIAVIQLELERRDHG